MSDALMQQAKALLPVEQPYDYHRALKQGPVHRQRRDSAARPTATEMAIPNEEWAILIHADAQALLQTAAGDLRDYLDLSMQVNVGTARAESLADWSARNQVIVAGTRDQMPGIGDELRGSKDYEIRVTPSRIAAEECHRINPAVEILPWEYNIDFRPQRVELKRYVTSLLPADTIPLLTWENGKAFELDGLHGFLRDYSISQVGPAEVAAAQIAEAKSREMPVYCKVDCFATWQFGTTPYLPCPQQWQRRYEALAEHGVDGTLETWNNGYKPNFIAELRAWSCWTNPLEFDTLLRAIARREFGAGSEDLVLTAWEHFSRAIQLVPDTGPSMGTNAAVSNPIFLDEPPARIMTLHNSWWDVSQKSHWRHRVDPYWPYAHPVAVFTPDFTNRTNRAESYARERSGVGAIEPTETLENTAVLPIFSKYLLLAADEFEAGLKFYRQAALNTPEAKRPQAVKEALVVEQMQRMLRSVHAILQFEDLRFRFVNTDKHSEMPQILDRMSDILTGEIERTEAALETARRDSRLGYECEMDYVYTPYTITEKLRVLHDILERQIPSHRERTGR